MSTPVESANAASDASVVKSNKAAALEEHLHNMHVVYVCKTWFQWVGNPVAFAQLCLDISGYNDQTRRFATLPLFSGDDVALLRKSSFLFGLGKSWSDVDNKLLKFECSLQNAGRGGQRGTVFTFSGSTNGTEDGFVASLTIPNGSNNWVGATGYTTFFTSE